MKKAEDLFAANLKRLRKRRGLTQQELSKKAGLGPTTLQAFEYQTRWPAPETLNAIADALQVSPGELFSDPNAERQRLPISEIIRDLESHAKELEQIEALPERVKALILDQRTAKEWDLVVAILKGTLKSQQ